MASRLTLVVPCYNEASRLDQASFDRFLSANADTRFLFVDDGSTDGTVGILSDLVARWPLQTEALHLPRNRGKAEAVRRGLLTALERGESELVGFWDADLATPLETAPRFVTVLNEHPEIDMVFGARVQLLGRSIRRRPSRHYLGRVFATVVANTLQLEIYDSQCGAKIFRAGDPLRGVLAEPFLSRWVFDVEILARWLQQECRGNRQCLAGRIYEYPLEAWSDVGQSKVRPSDFIRAFLDVVRIWYRYLRRRDASR